ncbi:acyl transferase domain-containing protein [Trichoderma chlorosporum]
MGQQLLQFPAFRQSIRRIDQYVATLPDPPDWTVEEMMQADVSSRIMDEPRFAQLMTVSLELGLVDLLADWGIRPSMVAGHSTGEIAATYASGYLTLDEAAAAAYYRGKATSEAVMMPGAMLAVGLPVTKSREIIPNGTQVVVAAVNSPASVTLSGGREAIEAIKIWCDKEQIFNRLIASNGVAYHSALMEPAAEAYSKPLKALPRSSTKPNIKARWYSTVTGELYTKETVPMMYWCQNMKSPVLFMPAVAAMRDAGMTHLIEIGPHSTLRSPIMDIIKATPSDKPFSYHAAVRRKADAVLGIMNMCGELALAGVGVDVPRVNGSPGVHLSGFPTYAWSHQAIVQESRVNREWRLKKHPRHELLGSLIPGSATNTKIWRNILSSSRIAWLNDYKFGSDCILPTSGFVCMANEAMRQTCEPSEDTFTVIEDLAIREALLVNSDVEIFLTMTQLPLGSNITSTMVWDFNICSVRDDVSTQHCQGRIYISAQAFTASKGQSDSGDGLLKPLSVPATKWYTDLASKRGIALGERFRRMDDMFFEKQVNYAVASVDLDSPSRHLTPSARADSVLDPTVLESCFSLPLLAAGPSQANQPYLPVSIDRLTISNEISKGCKVRIDANANYLGLRSLEASCSMKMAEKITVGIQGLRFSRLPRPDNPQTQQMRLPFWQFTWVDDYHGITAETQDLYFPPGKYWPELYNKYSRYRRTYLAHMWVVQFAQRHPDLLLKEPVSDQHKYFIEWINWLLDVTRRDHPEILNMSLEERDSAIESERCVSDLGIKLSWTIYDHLPEFIEGTRSALDMITQTGLLDNFYDTQLVFNKFERVVEIMGLRNPSMRILEIGAGTGTATKHVLKSLTKGPTQLYSSYTFTDISPSYFETAAATFAEYPDMEYRVYDMENPPKEQGIEPASYDVVVASCVVHTTPNIVRALQSIRKLLRPGGMLLLSEITAEHHDLNFSLGLLPGFYSGYDEGRKRHPFLTPAQWTEALTQAGFTTPEVSVNDVPEDWHAFTVLAATAVELNSQQVCAEDQQITIVSFDKPTDLAKCIEDGAQRQGASVAHRSLNLSKGHYETRVGQKAGRLIVLVDLEQVVDAGAEDVDRILREMAVPLLEEATSLLWVTQKSLMGGDQPARSYLHERMVQYGTDAGLKVASMDFEAAAERGEAMAKEILRRESLLLRLEDTEFRQLEGRWLVPRLLPDRRLAQDLAQSQGLDRTTLSTLLGQSGRLQLSAKSDGSLDTLAFEKNMNVDGAIPSGYLEIQVKAIGVNMMNLLGLTGSQGADCLISEFAGVVAATADDVVDFLVGDAVFGLWPGRFDNLARVPQSVCQRMRPGDSFEAAATLPLAYGTAWQAVVEAGRARSGDRVLIQSAAGGVGMAAVNVARSVGAEVYATAGSVAKRAALRDLGIPEHRIFSSRDAAEEPAMRRATGGRGFDVVLNTSSGDYLHAVSWPLVAPFGRFVELRKSTTLAAEAGIWNLRKMSQGISIIPVDMTYLCEQRRSAIADVMQAIGARYRSGVFAPLPYRSFPISQLRQVYSEFSRFEHTGKLVLTCDDDDAVPCLPMPEAARFHDNGSYLLIGAMGELMVHLTMWMVQSGVRHLIFLHAGPPPSARAGFFDNLVAAGVTVAHVESSTINRNDVQQAVASASTLPLRGIVNVAAELQESPREGAQGQQATVPGHVLSMMISGYPDLDFSILLGATANVIYGGLPWTKIHLTPAQTTHEMLELICVALSDASRRAAKRVQEPIYIVPHTDAGSSNNPCSNAQHQDARWAVVKSHNSTQSRRAARALSNGYSAATSAGIVGAIDDIRNQVVDRLSKLLWIPQERLRAEMSLHGVGIDSMIASEFRSWIQQTFRTSISMMELLSQNMTIEKLAKVLGGEN